MPTYQIMYWKSIPAQVKVFGAAEDLSAELPPRFQEVIDDVAMRLGLAGTDDYLEGWEWGDEEEMAGTAEEVLAKVMASVEAKYPATKEELLRHCLKQVEG